MKTSELTEKYLAVTGGYFYPVEDDFERHASGDFDVSPFTAEDYVYLNDHQVEIGNAIVDMLQTEDYWLEVFDTVCRDMIAQK